MVPEVGGEEKSRKTIVTMLSESQSKIGEAFIYRGFGQKCCGCRYFNVCAGNLREGRIYKVVNVRNKIFKCEIYDIKMRVVDVIEAEINAAIPSKQAIEGVTLTFHPQKCDEGDCENNMLCMPDGLVENDRCEVVKIYGRIICPQGLQLMKVLLRRVPSS
ncbi:MAG: UPF0179 family protein [Candidatus Bathyarchaeia archaeon]